MSLLTIVQRAASLCNLSEPSAVVSSNDPAVKRLYRLSNVEGDELSRRGNWTVLTKEKTFTTVATAVQTSAISTDFDRFVDGTMFNRTTNRRVKGPITAEDWQREKASVSVTTFFDHFRVRGSDLLLTPTPTAGETIAYEYITENWCESSGGTAQNAFAADSDVTDLPERLIVLGLVWRFQQAVGVDYSEDFRTYQMEVDKELARDGGMPVLSLETRKNYYLAPNIPDGNYGQ